MTETRRKFDQDFKDGAARIVEETASRSCGWPGRAAQHGVLRTKNQRLNVLGQVAAYQHCRYPRARTS